MKWLAAVAVLLMATSSGALAQGRQGRQGQQAQQAPGPAQEVPGISPAEIQRMFDASALLQAQQQLQIRDDQFPQFLSRFKALQDIRRQALVDRAQNIQQLRRLLMASGPNGTPDETLVNQRLRALQDIDARLVTDVAKAYEAIDQILDVRQRAQLRVFEEVMERQKLELVMRARQTARPRAGQQF